MHFKLCIMAAIHSLSDNLQGILVELSEKIEKLEEKNTELEERTKELESKEVEMKTKVEEMIVDNTALQERVTTLEQQLNAEAESKLKELLEARDNEVRVKREERDFVTRNLSSVGSN